MKIIESKINDIPNDLTEVKTSLINNVIEYIQPLFSNEYIQKLKEVKKLKKNIELKKEQIKQEKEELEKIKNILDKKIKNHTSIEKINKLVMSGLVQNSMKKELIILLKTFKDMDYERINSYLNEMIKNINQKFAKT